MSLRSSRGRPTLAPTCQSAPDECTAKTSADNLCPRLWWGRPFHHSAHSSGSVVGWKSCCDCGLGGGSRCCISSLAHFSRCHCLVGPLSSRRAPSLAKSVLDAMDR